MKKYAIKCLADHPHYDEGHILLLESKTEPNVKAVSPDVIVSGTGTEGDPYVYAATAELIGELPKDNDGNYIMPDRKYRAKWKDDESGGVEVVQADQEEIDREETLQAIRDYRQPLLEEADIEINKLFDADGDTSAWKTYRQALRDVTETYKNTPANLDSVNDVATDVSWATKPS